MKRFDRQFKNKKAPSINYGKTIFLLSVLFNKFEWKIIWLARQGRGLRLSVTEGFGVIKIAVNRPKPDKLLFLNKICFLILTLDIKTINFNTKTRFVFHFISYPYRQDNKHLKRRNNDLKNAYNETQEKHDQVFIRIIYSTFTWTKYLIRESWNPFHWLIL